MLKIVANKDSQKQAHVIVVGNEKGGSGKTTTTMHIITGLVKLGFDVGSIDIDARQQTLTRYFENRLHTTEKEHITLPTTEHYVIYKATGKKLIAEAEQDEHDRYMERLAFLSTRKDFIVVDTPGSDSFLSRLAHSHADTVITPINDSFVDFDVLAKVNGDTGEIVRPSVYAEMMWNQRMVRAQRAGNNKGIDWIVMRNRLSHLDAKNKRKVEEALDKLSKRVGFRIATGFSERVIYRELFLKGLTLLDLLDSETGVNVTISHIAARAEIRDLLYNLRIDSVTERLNEKSAEKKSSEAIAEPQAEPQQQIEQTAQNEENSPVYKAVG